MSGSAYKLVNKRAYHHGTMLLSASLGTLGSSLRNDRGGRLVTKGVASVPAPVANLTDAFPDRAALLTHSAFVKAVIDEFSATYKATANTTVVDESVLRDPDMNQGRWQLGENFDELQSWDWVFGQTPEFTHTVSVTEPNQISQDSEKWGPFSLDIHSKNGLILDAILHSSTAFPHQRELERLTDQLHGQRYDSLATPPPPWHRSPTPSTVTVASEFHTWLQNVL